MSESIIGVCCEFSMLLVFGISISLMSSDLNLILSFQDSPVRRFDASMSSGRRVRNVVDLQPRRELLFSLRRPPFRCLLFPCGLGTKLDGSVLDEPERASRYLFEDTDVGQSKELSDLPLFLVLPGCQRGCVSRLSDSKLVAGVVSSMCLIVVIPDGTTTAAAPLPFPGMSDPSVKIMFDW
ncbi:hypothetical protein O181_054080 [Austropuccinia psidii MF-1]|uniref:Uncharacterized protein n=1 Tax=Austropuccinia psidii MF-1 TaxID=1389203 RepID=A0A9Q3E1R9_9BASI|nr:hypothetical protein [Austropuccinia psidii MF-1]